MRNKWLKYLKWVPVTIVLILFCFISFAEYWTLGVMSNPKAISNYPFGMEGPVAGLWHYNSVENYVFLSLISGLTSLCIAISIIIYRKSNSILFFVTMHFISILTIFSGRFI
jgi:hypothetical protein